MSSLELVMCLNVCGRNCVALHVSKRAKSPLELMLCFNVCLCVFLHNVGFVLHVSQRAESPLELMQH